MSCERDKKLHFVAGFIIAILTMPFGLSFCVLCVSLAAVGKEIYDFFFKGTVDIKDIFATLLGGIAYIGVLSTVSAFI